MFRVDLAIMVIEHRLRSPGRESVKAGHRVLGESDRVTDKWVAVLAHVTNARQLCDLES